MNLSLLCEGVSMRSISRLVGVSIKVPVMVVFVQRTTLHSWSETT